MSRKRDGFVLISLTICLGIIFALSSAVKSYAQTSCTNNPTSSNTVTSTVTISQQGTYTIWSRLLAPDTTNNSFFLQIDGGCAIAVGDGSAVPANVWTWVNYQEGASTNLVTISLSGGDHTVKITEREGGVGVDKLLFTQDTACIPTGTGENCTVTNTPAVTLVPTQVPTLAPTSVPSQTYTTGWQPWNGSFDSGNNNWVSSTQVTTGTGSGTVQSISVYMGNVTAAPNNLMQVGIYADTGSNLPGTLLGKSGTQVITPNSWNTVPIGNVTIAPNTNYWLAFEINGSTTQFGWYSSTGGLSRWKNNVPFGTWPTTFGTPDWATTERYAIYMTYGGGAIATPTPTTVIPTNTPTPTAAVDTIAPTVSITSPANGATVQRNSTVTIQAQATDNKAVARVEFYVNGSRKGTDTTAPYTYNWLVPNKRNTSFNLSARAYDAAGNRGTSTTVTVKTNR